MHIQRKRKMVDENMKKYNEDDVELFFLEIGKLCNEIDVGSIEGRQLDLCKGNIILSHADCFCLQGKKRKMKPSFCVPNTSVTVSAMK